MSIRAPFLLLGLIAASSTCAAPTLLVDARIHTLDPAAPHAEAMAWDEDGRLLALGTQAELRERFRGAREVSLGGQTVIPGLIDAHGHLMNLGHALLRANLMGASSKAEIVERLRQHAQDLPTGAWLLGRGWDQTLWPEAEFPTAADLDAHFPDRPVWLERVDGHAGWGNSLALAVSTRDLSGDWQPEGGRILRDDQGQATGVFIDSAEQFIVEAIPAPSEEVDALALERALAESARFGLTGVHDAGVSLKQLALYRRFADSGRLPLRIHAMANGDAEALDALCAMGHYRHPSGRLQMRSVKLYIDGALGSRGAALLEDYSDEPGNRGLLFAEPPAFEKILAKAHACGVQVAAHAIGDRGNRVVLDGMQSVLGEARGTDHRWRIEHAQVVALGDIPRFAQLGVIASMQPTHATSDMRWAQARLGEDRLAGAYAWRRMKEAGAVLALGSDFPVEAVDPVLGLHAAATRQDARGWPEGGWIASQKLDLMEALRGFTLDAAHAGFAESEVGSLEVGKRADFVVLSRPLEDLAPASILDLKVESTWVDGVRVYPAR
ncbi:amidohydrolase [uncultured Aquimonas sp.]|uniref:amidohydrolase n=1 Tax=uncultured Aquimonas sp. TaxID=385483 RepID=UPI00086EAEA7|nr:amidohydrolase [uncultured Aquimonas sp.]ODU45044.1 MAG: amidohydrolase [Xanthomonadaceae bacterium SCN 69-123]